MQTIEKFYKDNLSWDKSITDLIGKEHSEIDPFILERTPPLSFNKDGKIDLDIMYPPSMEIRTDDSPYFEFYKCIKATFNLDEIQTFCDIGCSTGHLVYNMLNHTDACGVEYFEYQKENSNDLVKECINVFDIRDPIDFDIEFDLVNCTEVAEHIDPSFLHIFLDNIKKITGKYLILTWSSTYPTEDGPPQHVSPLEFCDVEKIMNRYGFILDVEKTKKFIQRSLVYNNFYFWWRQSLTIWKKNET